MVRFFAVNSVAWLCFVGATLLSCISSAQYQDNPLNNTARCSFGAGFNTLDKAAACGEFVFSKKKEGPIVESRLGYSREFSGMPADSCSSTNNWQIEPGIFLGDGWRFGKLSLTGSIGLNMSIRRYCRIQGYQEEMRSVLLPTLGARVSTSLDVGIHWGIQLNFIGNMGFRNSYYGVTLGVSKFFKG